MCAYGFSIKNSDTILPNVYIADVDVGGLKHDAAVSAIERAVASVDTSGKLNVVLPDRTLTLEPSMTHAALDADGAVDAAMAYGRDGGPFKAIRTRNAAKKTRHDVSLQSVANLDTEYLQKEIDRTAAEVSSELVQPTVSMDEETMQIKVRTGTPKVSLNTKALYDTVLERFENSEFSDLSFDYDTVPCDTIDLQKYYDKYCTEMEDAYYDPETHELVPEVPGYGFDLAYYSQQIAIAEPNTEFIIQIEDLIPEVTLESLSEKYFADVLASYDSPHTAIPARTNNLDLACKTINGMILNPGEEFSFNKAVGERTEAKGYLPATVYLTGGVSQPEVGGGICQVASTIYYCCLMSDLEVTYREPHMYVVTYVPRGMDATVYWGSVDFRFKNSTEYPIRIDASVSGGYVHVKLVGTKPETDYDHITLSYETLKETPWKTYGVLDANAADVEDQILINVAGGIATDKEGNTYTVHQELVSPYTETLVMSYRHFVDANGKDISSEAVARSAYRGRDRVVVVTLNEPEVPDEPDEPVDPDDPFEPVDPDAEPDED